MLGVEDVGGLSNTTLFPLSSPQRPAMARVFLSHSSRDSAAAGQMKAGLEWQELAAPFLDGDKPSGVPSATDQEPTQG